MKTIKNILLILSCSVLLYSCDALDLYPLDSLSDENFWKNEADLKLYANNFYTDLPWVTGPGQDNQSDCYVPGTPNSWLFNQEVVPTSGGSWSWGSIRECNYFLQRYHKAAGDPGKINIYVAEVRWFRAMKYFELVRNFGDVPWYSKDLQTDDTDLLYKARDSRVLVVDSILADLDYAITWLPEPSRAENGRIHKDVAYTLKSRVCLYEASFRKYHGLGNYEELYRKAAEAAWQVMDSGRYRIWTTGNPDWDYYNFFIQESLENNSEIILGRACEKDLIMQNSTRQMEESNTGLNKAMIESYLCKDGRPISLSGDYEGDATLEDELRNRDPRLKQTIDNPELPFKIYTDGSREYRELPMIEPQYCTTGYYVMKFHSPDPVQWNLAQSTLDVISYRYAEILLNYAEAKAELGECTQEVLDETINRIRDRVGMEHLTVDPGFVDPNWPDYGYTLTPLLYEIRRERCVELIGEGFRWDDLVRWAAGKLIERPKTVLGMRMTDELKDRYPSFSRERTADELLIVYTNVGNRVWDNKLYLKPIPLDELTMNPNLVQNPGWK